MSLNKNLLGATLATAAALALATSPVSSFAADSSAAEAGVKCYGLNGCAGKFVVKKSEKECTDAGGSLDAKATPKEAPAQ